MPLCWFCHVAAHFSSLTCLSFYDKYQSLKLFPRKVYFKENIINNIISRQKARAFGGRGTRLLYAIPQILTPPSIGYWTGSSRSVTSERKFIKKVTFLNYKKKKKGRRAVFLAMSYFKETTIYILTDKRNATIKIKLDLFKPWFPVIMLELMKQKLLAVSCFEGISNFMQRYHQTGINHGRNLPSRMPRLSSNFQKTWIHWKIKKERYNLG